MIAPPRSTHTRKTHDRHDGQLYSRGIREGVRLLRDALQRGDLAEAQRVINMAENRIAERGRR